MITLCTIILLVKENNEITIIGFLNNNPSKFKLYLGHQFFIVYIYYIYF